MLSGKQPHADEQQVFFFFVFLTFRRSCTASFLAVYALRKYVTRVAAILSGRGIQLTCHVFAALVQHGVLCALVMIICLKTCELRHAW